VDFRSIVRATLCAALFSGAGAAVAQAPAGSGTTRVAVVSLDRILRDAPVAQAAQKRIESEFAKREQELKDLAARGQRLQEALQKDAVTMSEGDRRNREREIGELTREFQRKQTETREDFERRRKEEFGSIIQKADAAVRKIAESEKIDIVLQPVMFANPRIDITDRVIKQMAQ
jgi:outer membrane protein